MSDGDGHAIRVLALSGGVGGAKLALGLYHALAPWELGVVANTGDDFDHYGLRICPDLDTIMYTLSGRADEVKGWGVKDKSWFCMEALGEIGGETWFGLGDRDLAVHLLRTEELRRGRSLSQVTQALCAAFGVKAHVHPMSDAPVATIINTKDGHDLPFQHYFVKERCAPELRKVRYQGAAEASPHAALVRLVSSPGLRAIILCPSNPFVSINPILSLPGVRAALKARAAPVIAVSPLVDGKAVKGPLDKMLGEVGLPASNLSIARQYADFLDGMIVDTADAHDMAALPVPCRATNTLMRNLEDKRRLAEVCLDFADELLGGERSNRVLSN